MGKRCGEYTECIKGISTSILGSGSWAPGVRAGSQPRGEQGQGGKSVSSQRGAFASVKMYTWRWGGKGEDVSKRNVNNRAIRMGIYGNSL